MAQGSACAGRHADAAGQAKEPQYCFRRKSVGDCCCHLCREMTPSLNGTATTSCTLLLLTRSTTAAVAGPRASSLVTPLMCGAWEDGVLLLS